MAGGHEKAECGVAASGGWGKPNPVASAIGTAVVVALSLAYWGAKVVALWSLVFG